MEPRLSFRSTTPTEIDDYSNFLEESPTSPDGCVFHFHHHFNRYPLDELESAFCTLIRSVREEPDSLILFFYNYNSTLTSHPPEDVLERYDLIFRAIPRLDDSLFSKMARIFALEYSKLKNTEAALLNSVPSSNYSEHILLDARKRKFISAAAIFFALLPTRPETLEFVDHLFEEHRELRAAVAQTEIFWDTLFSYQSFDSIEILTYQISSFAVSRQFYLDEVLLLITSRIFRLRSQINQDEQRRIALLIQLKVLPFISALSKEKLLSVFKHLNIPGSTIFWNNIVDDYINKSHNDLQSLLELFEVVMGMTHPVLSLKILEHMIQFTNMTDDVKNNIFKKNIKLYINVCKDYPHDANMISAAESMVLKLLEQYSDDSIFFDKQYGDNFLIILRLKPSIGFARAFLELAPKNPIKRKKIFDNYEDKLATNSALAAVLAYIMSTPEIEEFLDPDIYPSINDLMHHFFCLLDRLNVQKLFLEKHFHQIIISNPTAAHSFRCRLYKQQLQAFRDLLAGPHLISDRVVQYVFGDYQYPKTRGRHPIAPILLSEAQSLASRAGEYSTFDMNCTIIADECLTQDEVLALKDKNADFAASHNRGVELYKLKYAIQSKIPAMRVVNDYLHMHGFVASQSQSLNIISCPKDPHYAARYDNKKSANSSHDNPCQNDDLPAAKRRRI